MTVSPTSGWLDFPALLAGRAPARTRTSLCSNSRAFPAHPAAMLGVMRRRLKAHFDTAIHGPSLGGMFRKELGNGSALLSDDYVDLSDISDYEAWPRDNKIDEAKALLRHELFALEPDAVYYQRQIETRYERTFFHWITAKALNELAQEGHIGSETQPLVGEAHIRFYWAIRNRYWKRRANAIRRLVSAFANSTMGHALGRQGELMFDAALPRFGFMPIPPFKNVTSFGAHSWSQTKHDLDRVFNRDGINYGVEIKNTLSYIDKSELDIKLQMCAHLSLRPLFIMRMAPKSYMFQIQQQGGFGLLFGKQLYPHGFDALAKRIRDELGLPVECTRDVQEGDLQRLSNWHERLIRRLASPGGT